MSSALLVPLLAVVVAAAALAVLYLVVRLAVAHGMVDAQRRLARDQVRGELGLGPLRSPNSRQ